MLALAQTIADLLKPDYGIGYRREYRFGPGFYAWGIPQVPDSVPLFDPEREKEDELISKWGQIGLDEKVYLRGLLRDVYPWNFVTQPQLTAKVGRLTLQQWIQKTPERGQLSPLTDEMMLWSVEAQHIPTLRQQLWEAGVIFDYTKFLDDDEEISEREALHRLLPDMGYSPEEIDFIADDAERRRRRQQRRKK